MATLDELLQRNSQPTVGSVATLDDLLQRNSNASVGTGATLDDLLQRNSGVQTQAPPATFNAGDPNIGTIDFGGGSSLQSQVPDFVQFPEFYGVSQEELSEQPNIDPLAIQRAPTLTQLNNPNEMAKWHLEEKSRDTERNFIPNLAIDFVKQTQPELIEQWQKQEDQGFFESFGESFVKDPVTKIPFLGSVIQIADDVSVLTAMKRLNNNNYKDKADPSTQFDSRPQRGGFSATGFDQVEPTNVLQLSAADQKARDEGILGNYLVDKAEKSIRGQSIGGQIGAGVSQMPAFMVEFMATGPGAGIVRGAVKKSVTGLTKKLIGAKASSGLGKATGFTAGAVTRTAQQPQQITKETTGELLKETDAELTEQGFTISQNTTPTKALLKGTASTFIEMFSEQAGKDIIGRMVPNKIKEVFESAFKKLNPNKKAVDLWKKGGFDGFIQEMGEEELAEIMRVGFGVDSLDEYKQNKTLESYLVKGGIIGIVGGVGKGVAISLPKPKKTIEQSEDDLSGQLERAPVEPVLLDSGKIDELATLDSLPDVPSGKIRLFRGESPTVKFKDLFPAGSLKDFAPDRDGSFWTSNLNTANFFKEKYGPDATVSFVDVPKADAAIFKVNGDITDIEFVLSDKVFKQGNQPIENEVTSDGPKATKEVSEATSKPEVVEAKGVTSETKEAKPTAKVPEVAEEVVADPKRAEIVETPKRSTRADLKKVEQPPIVSGRPVRPVKKTRPKTIKTFIRHKTGQVDLSERKQISEKALNKLKLSAEQRGSILGFRASKAESKEILQLGKNYIQDNLPLAVRGKASASLKGAIDPKGLEKLITTVDKLKSEFEHRQAKEGLVKALKKVTGRKAGKISQQARQQVDRIRKDFSLKSTPKKVSEELKARLEEIKNDPLLVDDHTIRSVLDKLEGAELPTIGDLPTARLKELTFAIETIKKLDNLQKDLMFGNMALERDEFKNKITTSLDGQKPLKRKTRQGEPEKNLVSEIWDRSLGPVESAQRIDDATEGAFKTVFYDNPKKQEDKYHSINHEGKDHLKKVLEDAGIPWGSKDLQNWSKITSKKGDTKVKTLKLNSGQTLTLSPAELMGLSLMNKDVYHQKKMINNNLVYSGFDITGPRLIMNKEDIANALALMSKKEIEVSEGIASWYKNQGTDLVNGTLNILGQSRILRPEYYPITVSKNKSQEYKNITPETFMRDFAQSSFLQETVEHTKPIVIRDIFEQFFEHVDQAAKARHLMMPVRNMMSLMGDPDIKAAITRVQGKQAIDYWNNRTKAIVQMGPNRASPTDKGYNKFMRKFGTHALGWNPSPILKQFGGLYPAASILSPKVFSNYAKALKNPVKISEEFMSGSPTLRNRYEMHASHLATQNLEDVQPLLGKQNFIDKSTDGLQAADKLVVSSIYLTVKNKIKKLNPKIKEKDLIRRAARETELVIAKTQNITSVLDMSGIAIDSKSNPILKPFTMFMSNAERMQNMIRQSTWILRKSKKTPADITRFVNTNFAVIVGNGGHSVVTGKLLRTGLIAGLAAITGADDELEKALSPEELYQTLWLDIIMEAFGNLYFVGDVTNMLLDAFSSNYWWRTDLQGPASRVVTLGVGAALDTAKVMKEGFASVKGQQAANRALFKSAEITFAALGIPAYPLRVTKKGMTQLLSDTKSGSGSRRLPTRRLPTRRKPTRRKPIRRRN